MKRFLFIAVTLVLSFGISSFAQDKSKDEKKDIKTVQQSDSTKVFNTICPVSTEDVDNEITYTYKGVTYAVCCKNCLKKFKNDPEKYISKLGEDGKSIKKKKE